MPLFLPPSSVSLSYFILAVSMRNCLGKHSCMSSRFPVAVLNGTFIFRSVKAMNNWKRSAIKQILLLLLEFLCTFSISYKILPYYVYFYCCLKRAQLLKIKSQVSSILAKGCILMIVRVRVCVRACLTWHDYPSLVEGESHGILLLLVWLGSDRPSGLFLHSCPVYFFPYSRLSMVQL